MTTTTFIPFYVILLLYFHYRYFDSKKLACLPKPVRVGTNWWVNKMSVKFIWSMSLNYKEKYGLCDFLLFVSVLLPSPLIFSSFDGPSTKNVLSANKMGVAEIKKNEQPKKEPFTTFVILFNNMLRYCCRFFFFFLFWDRTKKKSENKHKRITTTKIFNILLFKWKEDECLRCWCS